MSEPAVVNTLKQLRRRGWIPLSGLSVLLDHSFPQVIYERQRGKNPVPIVRVGSTNRVYEDTVFEELNKHKNQVNAQWIIGLYGSITDE